MMLRPTTGLLAALLVFPSCGSAPSGEQAKTLADNSAQTAMNTTDDTAPTASLYALRADSLEGKPIDLSSYEGKVTLVVNVASECGYTRQYAGLQQLHADMKGRGFAVLGFPSNDFGGQEPGSAAQIREFCTSKYAVDFPMFAKVVTKDGNGQSPVYATLASATGKSPNWNFCKYLVGKNGEVLGFYPSATAPDSPELKKAIEKALQ